MSRTLGGWLVRGLVVACLVAGIGLLALMRPTSEQQPTATPAPTMPPSPTFTPTATATATPTPTPTPTPTITPTPTPACTETAGRVESHTYFSPVVGGDQTYRIYLPPCYDQSDERYPVVYLLHGWYFTDSHWDDLGADETADIGIEAGIYPPFIIVMPRGIQEFYVQTSGGDHSFEAQLVNDLLPHIDATYRTRAEREGRAIGGISRGGVWSLEIGFRHPDLFSSVGAHSPALSLNRAPQVYDPLHLVDDPRVATLHIYLDAGDADWARTGAEALHEALDERGISNWYIVHHGRHENQLWQENMAEYLAFYTAGW